MRKYIVLLAVAIALPALVYFKIFIPKHTFTMIRPTKGELQVTIQGIGNVNALRIYSITAQTGGKIVAMTTDEGQWVKKGDLLLVMDGVDMPRQLEIARANLGKAENDVKALQGELENQKAQKALLQITFDRYAKLNKRGFVAQAEYDKARSDLLGIRGAITATTSRIASSNSAVVAARKSVEALQEKIDRLKVSAPADGYVISREAEVAQYVQPSMVVYTIVDAQTLWVEAKIDERLSARVKEGQEATIILRSQPDHPYTGVVRRINAMTDAVTLERKINVAFEHIPVPFFINEQARVIIAVQHLKDVTKLPRTVVVQKGGRQGGWTVRAGKAHFLPLTIVDENATEIAIQTDQRDLSIIVPDPHKKSLREGMRIYQ